PGAERPGVASRVLAVPRVHDLRGNQRDPAQHHRRARARASEGLIVDFDFSDEQYALRDLARELFQRESPPSRLRSLWTEESPRDGSGPRTALAGCSAWSAGPTRGRAWRATRTRLAKRSFAELPPPPASSMGWPCGCSR